jgi:hypothetical protein
VQLVRPVLALVAGAGLVLAGPAGAASAPKPVCNLVTDQAGDASVQPPLPSDDSLDIVSADLASNAKSVTAVLRLKSLGAASPYSVTGRNYYLLFNVPGATNPVYFSAESDVTGTTYHWGDLETVNGLGSYTSKGTATGVTDVAKNEIRITTSVSDLAVVGKAKPGNKLSALHASTTAVLGVLVADVDTADGSKSYVAGAPSCVKPGA